MNVTERAHFCRLLRARQLELQKTRLRHALERMPAREFQSLTRAILRGPELWPVLKSSLDGLKPS